MRGRKPKKNRSDKACVPCHRSLFKECDSDSDVLCGGPPVKEEKAFLKHESDDLEISMQHYQEDSPFCLRSKAVLQRKLSILTPLLCLLHSNVPSFTLPERSDDLLLPNHQVLPACDVYEVLRKLISQEVWSGNVFFLFSSKWILFLIPGETLPVPFRWFHGFIAIWGSDTAFGKSSHSASQGGRRPTEGVWTNEEQHQLDPNVWRHTHLATSHENIFSERTNVCTCTFAARILRIPFFYC